MWTQSNRLIPFAFYTYLVLIYSYVNHYRIIVHSYGSRPRRSGAKTKLKESQHSWHECITPRLTGQWLFTLDHFNSPPKFFYGFWNLLKVFRGVELWYSNHSVHQNHLVDFLKKIQAFECCFWRFLIHLVCGQTQIKWCLEDAQVVMMCNTRLKIT